MRAVYALIATVFTAVSLSGCGDGGTTTNKPASVTTTAPHTGTGTQTIVDLASGNDDLTTLVAQLSKFPDLIAALNGAGPLTVFAPTNAAFAAIQDIVDGLTEAQLKEVLQNHVFGGLAYSYGLTNGEEVPTLFTPHNLTVALGAAVTISSDSSPATVATVTMPNVNASNGVVHIVDKVLVPDLTAATTVATTVAPASATTTVAPASVTTTAPHTGTGTQTIVDLASGNDDLSTLVTQLSKFPDLIAALNGAGPFTVFAPTNAAFTAIQSTVDGLTEAQLKEVLQNHVYGGLAYSYDLADGEAVPTLFTPHELTVALGAAVTISSDSSPATVATVTIPNVNASNGVVHVVDAVLVPLLTAGAITLAV